MTIFTKQIVMHDVFELIRTGNLEEIRAWVKDKNTNKDVVNRTGGIPLHYAIELNNEKAAEIFVKNNLYIQSANWNNDTPLHFAAYHCFPNLISILIERGAIVNIGNKFGRFPLHHAAWTGHTVLVLIENGAEINVFDNDKETPLYHAVWSFKTAKTLLNEGASLLTNDNNGEFYLRRTKNNALLLKHHLKLQKYVVCRKKLFLTSGVFLKFLSTFKISFIK